MTNAMLSRSTYAAHRKRSPGALAAAIALNGGVVALLLALPATQYIRSSDPPIRTHWVTLPPPPPPIDPSIDKPPAQNKSTTTPTFVRPTAVDPVVTLGDTLGGDLAGSFDTSGLSGSEFSLPPLVQPAEPVFVKARLDPRYTDSFRPDYPAAMRRLGKEAQITVRVHIDAQGHVVAVDQLGTGNAAFFEAARRHALHYWHFLPATRDGKPVASEQTLTLQFRLEA